MTPTAAAQVADVARERRGALSVRAVHDCPDVPAHAGLARRGVVDEPEVTSRSGRPACVGAG